MKYQVNLFPQKDFNLADRLIYFTFHYLRYILVVTQLVVIGVFFYRFKIDQEIVDLKDSLSQKQEIVTISAPLLKEVGVVDKKMKNVTQVLNEQGQFGSMLAYVISVYPDKAYLDRMIVKDNTLSLDGVTNDANAIKLFYNRLRFDKKFKTIELKNLTKNDSGFKFSLVLTNFIAK